ncbi:hypothetical protein SLS58_010678 [Diplodia intermedia]|uniref:Uncharacterized protein n=1 Tax=Diplodia intermedia TaxID=856260 RepID=A0ABR3T4L0_9PEZI
MTRKKPVGHSADPTHAQHLEKIEQKASRPECCTDITDEALKHHNAFCAPLNRKVHTTEFVATQEKEPCCSATQLLRGRQRDLRRPFPLSIQKQPGLANAAVQDICTPNRAAMDDNSLQLERGAVPPTRLREQVDYPNLSSSPSPRLRCPRSSELAPTDSGRLEPGDKKSDDCFKDLYIFDKDLDDRRHVTSIPRHATSMYSLSTPSSDSTPLLAGVMATADSIVPLKLRCQPDRRDNELHNFIGGQGFQNCLYHRDTGIDMVPPTYQVAGESLKSSSARPLSELLHSSSKAALVSRPHLLEGPFNAGMAKWCFASAEHLEEEKHHPDQLGGQPTMNDSFLPFQNPPEVRQPMVKTEALKTQDNASTAFYSSQLRLMFAKTERLDATLKMQQATINTLEATLKTQEAIVKTLSEKLSTLGADISKQQNNMNKSHVAVAKYRTLIERPDEIWDKIWDEMWGEIYENKELDTDSVIMQTIKGLEASKASAERLIKDLESRLDNKINWLKPDRSSRAHKTATAKGGTNKKPADAGVAVPTPAKRAEAGPWRLSAYGDGGFRMMRHDDPMSNSRHGYPLIQKHQSEAGSSVLDALDASHRANSSNAELTGDCHDQGLDMTGQYPISIPSTGDTSAAPKTKDLLPAMKSQQKDLDSKVTEPPSYEALKRKPSDWYMRTLKEIVREEVIDSFKQKDMISDSADDKAKMMARRKLWFGDGSYPYSDEDRNNDKNLEAFIRKQLALSWFEREKIAAILEKKAAKVSASRPGARADEHSDGQSKEKTVGKRRARSSQE